MWPHKSDISLGWRPPNPATSACGGQGTLLATSCKSPLEEEGLADKISVFPMLVLSLLGHDVNKKQKWVEIGWGGGGVFFVCIVVVVVGFVAFGWLVVFVF